MSVRFLSNPLQTQTSPDHKWQIDLYSDSTTALGMKIIHLPSGQNLKEANIFNQDNPRPYLIAWNSSSDEFAVFYKKSEVDSMDYRFFSVKKSGSSIVLKPILSRPKWLLNSLIRIGKSNDPELRKRASYCHDAAFMADKMNKNNP